MPERQIREGETYLTVAGSFRLKVEEVLGGTVTYRCLETRQVGECSIREFKSRIKQPEAQGAFRK